MTSSAKFTVLAFLLGLSTMVSAAGGVAVDAHLPEGAEPVMVRFAADEKLGMAWAEVQFLVDDPVGEGVQIQEAKVLVPGLAYDSAMRAVKLEESGETVVCATRKRILLTTTYRETPACRLRLGAPMTPDAGRVVIERPASTASAVARER